MSLVCYLDDSGNEDDPIVTLAGYIAPAGDWLNFEVHARELFRELYTKLTFPLDYPAPRAYSKLTSAEGN